MLKIGQKLWYYDQKENHVGYVLVADLHKDGFDVWHNGMRDKRPYSVLGRKLHASPPKAKPNPRLQSAKRKSRNLSVHPKGTSASL